MTSHNFGQFLTHPPPIVTHFSGKALVLLSQNPSLIPSPPLGHDVVYERPLIKVLQLTQPNLSQPNCKCKFFMKTKNIDASSSVEVQKEGTFYFFNIFRERLGSSNTRSLFQSKVLASEGEDSAIHLKTECLKT